MLAALAAHAEPAPSRKVGFIGCLSKPADAELGAQISESVEKLLVLERVPDLEFLPDAVGRARAKLKGGPVNPQRVAEAGRALGADKVVVCLMTYSRERAAVEPGKEKTTNVSQDVTDYEEETYYQEVPNPDYEPPVQANIPIGRAGPVGFFVTVGGKGQPKTIQEKHVRRVPVHHTVNHEVTETGPETEKSGYIRLRASYVIMDAASGKIEERDTVSYVNELQPMWDGMETDQDARRAAAESTVASLEHGILEKLKYTSTQR
jgi:hypothetical protein